MRIAPTLLDVQALIDRDDILGARALFNLGVRMNFGKGTTIVTSPARSSLDRPSDVGTNPPPAEDR